MLTAGKEFVFHSRDIDESYSFFRRVTTRGLLSYRAGVAAVPRGPNNHQNLVARLLTDRKRFRRGVGEKRYSKWIETRTSGRGRFFVSAAPFAHLEGRLRWDLINMKAMPLWVRRLGTELKRMVIRRKR